jgi:hypothetical protein
MLNRQLARMRRDPAPAVLMLAGGLLAGVALGALLRHGGAPHASAAATPTAVTATGAQRKTRSAGPTKGDRPATPGSASRSAGSKPHGRRVALEAAIEHGVKEADDLEGEASEAVWVDGDAQPVLGGPAGKPHRLWSISKAVVTIAALDATHDRPEPVMWSAITDAIRRSDNCAIRRVIVGLQDNLAAGVPGTVAAFEHVLGRAGARIAREPQSAPAEAACVHYLERHQGGLRQSDLATVPQFGTAEWTERDAISFAHTLASGDYGTPGAYLLELMGQPKEPPLEEPPPPSAPPLDWGAGAVFPASWTPAWKAGWGGSQDRPAHFIAGQIAVVEVATVPVALAAVFVPRAEPATDNPGITQTPKALELMFEAARSGLERERIGRNG